MTNKAQQVKQAAKGAKASKKGAIRRKYRIRYNLRFYKPHTLKLASKPKYERSKAGLKMPAKFDKYAVLVQPLVPAVGQARSRQRRSALLAASAPEATPKASASGKATAATVSPASRSFWNVPAE